MFDSQPLRGFPIGLRRVAVYLRKSREDRDAEQKALQQGGEYDTLARHRSTLLEIAGRQNYTVRKIHAEVVSGESIDGRPQMVQLLAAIERGDYDAVLCMAIDRLGRGDMRDQGRILAAFKQSQTLIVTPDKVYDLDDEMDEEMTEFRAFMSRKEYQIIRKRLERGRHQSIRQGKFVYPRAPYGYVRGNDSVLQIHPEQAKIVRLIFAWYLAGHGPTMIAHRLTTLCVPSPLGKSMWWPEQLVFMLRNPIYRGQIRHGHQQRNRVKKKPTEIYEGLHEGIIETDVFERVQAVIGRPTTPGPKRPKNPLRGLIRCAFCGRPYQYMPAKYRNVERLHCDTPGCAGGSLNIAALEDIILDRLSRIYANLTVEPEQAPLDRSGIEAIEMEIDQVTQELAQIDLQRNNAFDLLERGIYTVSVFEERQRVLSDRQREIGDRIPALEHDRETQIRLLNERLSWIPTFVRVLDLYRDLTHPDEKNELLRELVDYAVIRKEKSARSFNLELHLRLPVGGETSAAKR